MPSIHEYSSSPLFNAVWEKSNLLMQGVMFVRWYCCCLDVCVCEVYVYVESVRVESVCGVYMYVWSVRVEWVCHMNDCL